MVTALSIHQWHHLILPPMKCLHTACQPFSTGDTALEGYIFRHSGNLQSDKLWFTHSTIVIHTVLITWVTNNGVDKLERYCETKTCRFSKFSWYQQTHTLWGMSRYVFTCEGRNSANLLRPMHKSPQKQKLALQVTKWFQGSVVVLVSGHNRELFCDALRDIKTLTAIPTSWATVTLADLDVSWRWLQSTGFYCNFSKISLVSGQRRWSQLRIQFFLIIGDEIRNSVW